MNDNPADQPITPPSQDALYKQGMQLIPIVAGCILRQIPSYASVTRDDLESAGREGLVDAVRKYNPQRGNFKSYAEWRIKGAMLDEIRGTDHLSRCLREETSQFSRYVREFEQEHGRSPDPEEAMRDLYLDTLDEYHALHFAADLGQSLRRLETVLPSGDQHAEAEHPESLRDTKNPENAYLHAETNHALREGLARLTPKQRELVDMLAQGNSPADIARELGVTEGAISHRLRGTEETLRQYFERRGLLS